MPLIAFDHVNIRTAHLDEMVAWYAEILGLRVGPRPEFSIPGAWLYLGDRCVLHLLEADPAPMVHSEAESLRMEHIAFRAEGIDAFIAHLEKHGLAYKLFPFEALEIVLVFIRDRTETAYTWISLPPSKTEGPPSPSAPFSGRSAANVRFNGLPDRVLPAGLADLRGSSGFLVPPLCEIGGMKSDTANTPCWPQETVALWPRRTQFTHLPSVERPSMGVVLPPRLALTRRVEGHRGRVAAECVPAPAGMAR